MATKTQWCILGGLAIRITMCEGVLGRRTTLLGIELAIINLITENEVADFRTVNLSKFAPLLNFRCKF
ncbi:MAG: hypothetical protein F4082_02840 [Gammaproteobacteria bacterium]|nr:hypothetical protein [Gammaproteobacteria bacterium]